jgi:hypothetical protein
MINKTIDMNKDQYISKMTEEAMNSLDGMSRAGAKPYLLTRINARLSNSGEGAWERAGRFIARPAVAFSILCMVIGINASIIFFSSSKAENTNNTEQLAASDDFSTTVASLYDTENTEPQ